MKIRRVILLLPVVSVIVLSLLVKHHAAKSGAPHQAASPSVAAGSK